MQKLRLNETFDIFSGVPTNKIYKSQQESSFEVKLLTGESIQVDGTVKASEMKSVWVDRTYLDKFLLEEGDVVAQLRGVIFKAAIISKELLKTYPRIITSSNNAILKTKSSDHQLLPEVACYIFNSEWFKRTVIQYSQSNFTLTNINKLKELQLPVIQTDQQQELKSLFYADLELKKATLNILRIQKQATENKFITTLYS